MPELPMKFEPVKGVERFIAYQRTAYQHPINRLFRSLRIGKIYDHLLLPFIESQRSRTILNCYFEDMRKEYLMIKDQLPDRVSNVLDIGSGVAGLDIFLYAHFGSGVKYHLLDKDGKSNIYYGFRDAGSYYNSLELAKKFLTTNGVPEEIIRSYDISVTEFPNKKFELVISLLSWGFHYPIDEYVGQVFKTLQRGGVVIVDVRRGTTGIEVLSRAFSSQPEVLHESDKFQRVKFIKK
jgi:SAM-dependent methyltransferase